MDPGLRGRLRATAGIEIEAATPILGLGDECELWHVTAPAPCVVRIAPPWRSASSLKWAYGIAHALGLLVPEVVRPSWLLMWADRVVTIWPYVAGRHLDRESADERDAAARLLARLHRAALVVKGRPRRPRPPDPAAPPPHPDPYLADAELDATLAALPPDLPRGPVHGDFYRRNILVDRDRLALLDWDEARLDALVTELAWSAWEFGKSAGGDALDEARAARFLAAYEGAGGPAYPRNMIVPLIRANLRAELERGGPHDPAYDAAERRAFVSLRSVTAIRAVGTGAGR